VVEEGAEMIDIGGESTRPNATPVSEEEELKRVLPVIEQLAGRVKVPISIDTQKPGVAVRALEAGASVVNDIAANREEPRMWEIVAGAGAGYVAMHMKGTPQTMQANPTYGNVVEEVACFFADRLMRLAKHGIDVEQTVLDVGIGFGKKVEHNLELLASLNSFTRFQRPLLLGVSRKSFISRLMGGEVEDRLPGALACACWAVQTGVQIIRAHDVRATVHAVRMMETILEVKCR
jgi:dihydropteroate synthase